MRTPFRMPPHPRPSSHGRSEPIGFNAFDDRLLAEQEFPQPLGGALHQLMGQINLRALINTESEIVRYRALRCLFEGNTNEVIETRLRQIGAVDPRTFSPINVHLAIALVNAEWKIRTEKK